MITVHWMDVALVTSIVTGIGACFGVLGIFLAAEWLDRRGKRD
jgi:hypothetical protein